MPIVAAEPDVYPEDLLEQTQLGSEQDSTWWALYCLSRKEKRLMRRLRKLGVAHYCPLVAKRNLSPGGRVRISHVPLFQGYAFVHGSDTERYLAVSTGCVSRCLQVPNRDALSHDLRQIYYLLKSGAALIPEPRLTPGVQVRVTSGPFQGVEGVVIRRENKTRLVVAVKYLRQGASMLLNDFQVEPIT